MLLNIHSLYINELHVYPICIRFWSFRIHLRLRPICVKNFLDGNQEEMSIWINRYRLTMLKPQHRNPWKDLTLQKLVAGIHERGVSLLKQYQSIFKSVNRITLGKDGFWIEQSSVLQWVALKFHDKTGNKSIIALPRKRVEGREIIKVC